MRKILLFVVLIFISFLWAGQVVLADEQENEEKKPYTSSTSLSLLFASGNTKDLTFGFDTEQSLSLKKNQFQLKGSAIYSQSNSKKETEHYYGHLKYKRTLVNKTYLLGFGRFEKNVLAGYKYRLSFSAGAGFAWIKKEKTEFSTEATLGWNSESNVIPSQNLDGDTLGVPRFKKSRDPSSFMSFMVSGSLKQEITSTSHVDIQELFFLNLREGKDFRISSLISLAAGISKSLALKFSYQIHYSHQPVPGFKSTDHYFFCSLVLNL
ncbi:MAG: DUF481 domain-containing protein [Candidatus Aminicenantes bacterium]|jgi:putative salt-induced outer membrane protein YdiY